VPEEADWQRRARRAADALAEAKADARARGAYPVIRGRRRPAQDEPGGGAAPDTASDPARSAASGGPGGSPAAVPLDGGAGRGGPGGPGEATAKPGGAGQPGRPGGSSPRRPRRGGRTRREDPQPLSAALDGLLGDQGWRTAAAIGSVFGRWDQLVGPDVAAHTRPERFSDGELLVIADSSAWATQVRLLTSAVLRRLNEELGHGTVTRVVVRGPAPPRRMGPLRVRGSRQHTDDYG
jgi:predicted nucleic acid-binding Zn ribbon protein